MNELIQKIKKIAIPSNELINNKDEIANIAIDLIKKNAEKYSQIMSVEFGGSYAKGTWIPGKGDIDIFMKFKNSVNNVEFTKITKKIGFESLKKFQPYTRYSDHPYVEAVIKKTKINVVPCYNVKMGSWKSAADRSIFHTKFMLKFLSNEMKDDVRLLKMFLISNEVYGSEILRQGFSGYVTEVLIYNFKSFVNSIKSLSKLQEFQIIGNTNKKFTTPITIIDPIDSNRNLASAVSLENLGKTMLICRAFLNKPSMKYFKSKSSVLSKKNFENVIVIKFYYDYRSPDTLGGQIKKTVNALTVQMTEYGFKVIRNSVKVDKNYVNLLFLLETRKLNKFYRREGPNVFHEYDCNKFIMKNIKKTNLIWVNKKGNISILMKRQYVDAKQFLLNFLKNKLTGVSYGLKEDIKKWNDVSYFNIQKNKSLKNMLNNLIVTNEAAFPTDS